MIYRNTLFWLASIAILLNVAEAQEITGRVTDSISGEVLAGATIRVFTPDTALSGAYVATALGALSQTDGTFTIAGPVKDTVRLVISYVGYDRFTYDWWPEAGYVAAALIPTDALTPEVNVTATRRTRSVEDACCRVESIREEVQQHAPFSPSATDVLRRYSSCTSERITCSIEHTGTIRLRGLEPTYVSLLLDGMPAFTGLGAMYGLSLVPAHALQTISISEGASSARFGNGAISGVVDFQTRMPTEVPELIVSGNLAGHGFETPGQRDVNVSYTGLAGDVGLAAFGSYNDHQPEASGWGYQRASGLVKGNLLVDNLTELNVMALGGHEQRRGVIQNLPPIDYYSEESEANRFYLSSSLARSIGEESELTVSAMYSVLTLQHRIYNPSIGELGPSYQATQNTGYLNLVYNTSFGDHLVLFGSEISHNRMDDTQTGSDKGFDYQLTIPSLYVQDEYLLGDYWSLLGSLRLDHHSMAGTILSPRGSIRFAPEANLTMRLMAGQGFKGEALFNEEHLLLHNRYIWQPNPDFTFERSYTLNYDVSYSFLIGDIIGIDANFNTYYTRIEGKAIPHPDSLSSGTYYIVNSDQPTRLTGIELQIRPTFGEHWSGSLALALINYAMRQENGSYLQVALAPRANLDVSLLYHDESSGFSVETWGSHIGAQRLPENPTIHNESPAYTLVNLRVEKAFGPVSIFAGTFNLLDIRQEATMPIAFTEHKDVNGSNVWGPLEGREFFAGIRLRMEVHQ
jgi:outer membrane receptor for ferrienterochelin and colicin